ncbi:MAG TPA: DUF4260 domain-containing protein [Rhodocyclaceae bacterium]|nr:DUF4260 domain-containing protein [Rhodocyclaceae bacterium]
MSEQGAGAVGGKVRWVLRLEGLALLLAAAVAYQYFGSGWGSFALYFLLPDVAFIAYLAGSRWGAFAYNTTHATPGALALLMFGILSGAQVWLSAGLIWLAHIGFDRALGYGLKYAAGFRVTHLGLIGREKPSAS